MKCKLKTKANQDWKKIGNCARIFEMVVEKDTQNLKKNRNLIDNQLIKDTTAIIFKSKNFK